MQNSNEAFQEDEDQAREARIVAARRALMKEIKKRQRGQLTGNGSVPGAPSVVTPERQGVFEVQSTPVCSDGSGTCSSGRCSTGTAGSPVMAAILKERKR
eukprot:3668177-Prymnesium_polylepis.1